MPKIEPRTLRGFRDYLPAKMIPRQKMIASIERTFQRFGFVPLMTPALEYLEILTGKYGEEGDQLLYRFKDNGGRDVGLRYDLTVPLARVAAQYPAEVSLPFRRYQIAPVWRAENPARGRFREFVQCDADIVGSRDMAADAELVTLGCELLQGLGVEQFTVRINNRKILAGLMASIGVEAGAAEMGILRTVDKLPKIGEDETARLLREENGLDAGRVARIFEFLKIEGATADILARLERLFDETSVARKGCAELREVFAILEGAGVAGRVEVDLSIARGLTYYTGTIYETFLGNLPGYGSVMSGGRYDELVGVFRGEDIPAAGISLGIDRLLEGLVELKLLGEEKSVAPVLITVFGADTAAYSARVARLLRASGIGCELYPAYAKMKKQLGRAGDSGQRWVIIAGSDEIAKEQVKVKDMQSGEQEPVGLDALAAYLAPRVAQA
jgi:histidyl-tRNA synthetase